MAGELLWGAAAIARRAADLSTRATGIWARPLAAPLSLEAPVPDAVDDQEFDDDVDEPVPFTSSIDEDEDGLESS